MTLCIPAKVNTRVVITLFEVYKFYCLFAISDLHKSIDNNLSPEQRIEELCKLCVQVCLFVFQVNFLISQWKCF